MTVDPIIFVYNNLLLILQVLGGSTFSFSVAGWLAELFLADVRVPKQCISRAFSPSSTTPA